MLVKQDVMKHILRFCFSVMAKMLKEFRKRCKKKGVKAIPFFVVQLRNGEGIFSIRQNVDKKH